MRRTSTLFSDKDRADYTTIVGRATELLKTKRAHAYEIALCMIEVQDRGLWKIEGHDSIHAWAKKHFLLHARQVRKYLAIGKLTRQRVVDSDLRLDELEVVSESPEEIRDAVQEVAGQHIGMKALRAGKNAGIEILEDAQDERPAQERVQAAREAVKTVAEQVEAGKGTGRKRSAQKLAEQTAKSAQQQFEKLIELKERLEAGEAVPEMLLRSLVSTTAQMAQMAQALLDGAGAVQQAQKAVDCNAPTPPTPPAPPKAEPAGDAVDCKVPTPPTPEGAPDTVATTPTNATAHEHEQTAAASGPVVPAAVDLKPLEQAAIHVLDDPSRGLLGLTMYFLAGGMQSFEGSLKELRDLEAELERDAPLPAGVFAAWLRGLGQPDPVARRVFALRFCIRARLPGYPRHLKDLSEQDLPQRLRDVVQTELERLAERRRQRKDRRAIAAGP